MIDQRLVEMDFIYKAERGAAKQHKYLNRKRIGNRWHYEYPEDLSSKQGWISAKIRSLIAEGGYEQRQAAAIAYSMWRKKNEGEPEKKKGRTRKLSEREQRYQFVAERTKHHKEKGLSKWDAREAAKEDWATERKKRIKSGKLTVKKSILKTVGVMRGGKYIRRESKPGGGYKYTYRESYKQTSRAARSASSVAKEASNKAKKTGSKEDHEKAHQAHSHAMQQHQKAFKELARGYRPEEMGHLYEAHRDAYRRHGREMDHHKKAANGK